jgi:hypothetical protein
VASHPTIRELVEFGLGSVPKSERVEVSVRDLLFVHQVLGELNRFFHQPTHYPDVKAVRDFLGSRGDGGAYEMLAEAYYTKLGEMLPAKVHEQLNEAAFEHPDPPRYYNHGA